MWNTERIYGIISITAREIKLVFRRELKGDGKSIKKIEILISKAKKAKQDNYIDLEYWEKLLFDMTDRGEITDKQALKIDKILKLGLYT